MAEDDVASSGWEKPLAIAAFVEEEAAGAFDPWRGSSTDGDSECGGEGLADVHHWADVKGGLEELGTSRADGFRLEYLDVDLASAVVQQKPLAIGWPRQCPVRRGGDRHHSDPEYDGAIGHFDVAGANDVCAGPLQQLDDAVDRHGCRVR